MVLLQEYQLTEKKKKKKDGYRKEVVNIIRTTQRNNVELTHLADNKANVLLSLNAIMLTFLIPNVVSHTDYILERHLLIPLGMLAVTCFLTIFISTRVLMPSKFDKPRYFKNGYKNHSPLFFGNVYKMEPEEFFDNLDEAFASKLNIMDMLKQHLYYSGRRLGYKMTWIRRAFNIFLVGLFITIVSSFIAFLIG